MQTINISSDNFQTFMSVLSLIKDHTKNLSIIDGVILHPNNKRNVIYEVDLTSIIGNTTLYLDELDIKCSMLDQFKHDNVAVDLCISEDKYIWKDKYSEMSFRIPIPAILTPKPITFNSIMYSKIQECFSTLIFSNIKLENQILKRLKSTSKTIKATELITELTDNKVSLILKYQNNSDSIINNIYTIEDADVGEFVGYSRFPVFPFYINNLELFITMGIKKDKIEDKCAMKIESKIDDVSFKIYSMFPFKTSTTPQEA